MKVSNRAERLQWSPIRKLNKYADRAKEEGVEIYHLNIGQPDIPTPPQVLQALKEFDEKIIRYGPSQGLPELRRAIAEYHRLYDLEVDEDEIVITNGGSEALLFALSIIADDGDEIIIPEPYYTNYNGISQILGIKVIPVTTKAENGFHLPPAEEFEKRITPRTRAILLCTPNNPTGTVLTEEEMKMVVDLVRRHDLFLITDEVYREFTFDGRKHVSALKFKEVWERLIVVDSVSKRFSLCGARIGHMVVKNKDIQPYALKFAQARLCPPTVEQHLAIAAYRLPKEYYEGVRKEYEKRRDAVWEILDPAPDVILQKPEGAFYAVLKLPVKDSDDFARWLLTDYRMDGKTVMVAPANGFYASPEKGKDEVRIAYVLEVDKMRKAMHMLLDALSRYPGRK